MKNAYFDVHVEETGIDAHIILKYLPPTRPNTLKFHIDNPHIKP